jgi:crossover junction endodeoxyribonuclease RuvC
MFLSIDVGIRTCGYVICEIFNSKIDLIKEGEIKPPSSLSLPQRLNYIFEELLKNAKEYKPQILLLEKLYSHYRHPTTLGVLAQVRGIIVLLSYKVGMSFFEYSSTRIRKCFLGKGNVKSDQVKRMAENLTGRKFKSIHIADAFSLAVAFSRIQKVEERLSIR